MSVVPYGLLQSEKKVNFNLKNCIFGKRMGLKLCIEYLSGHQVLSIDKVLRLLLTTTTTYQNGRSKVYV